jgi:putative hydrolase of the HAD superfamily
MGIRLTPRENVELAERWYEPLSRCAKVEDNTVPTLRGLRSAGLKLGIVSNTFIPSQVLDNHLQREGLLDFFSVRVYSCDVGRRKPGKHIFQVALDRMDLAPGEVIFVGDSPKADVRGANKAGMVSVLKDPTGRYARSRIRPDHTIRGLRELLGIIEGHNGGSSEGRA